MPGAVLFEQPGFWFDSWLPATTDDHHIGSKITFDQSLCCSLRHCDEAADAAANQFNGREPVQHRQTATCEAFIPFKCFQAVDRLQLTETPSALKQLDERPDSS
jgi:hypothetical protein